MYFTLSKYLKNNVIDIKNFGRSIPVTVKLNMSYNKTKK